jgi:tetratricopeptide (TPR) repeat protein
VVTLLPTIGLVQIGAQARADRYMYLPLVGLSVMVAWGIPETLSRGRAARITIAIGAIAVLAALGIRTSQQIPVWHDSVALFEHGLEITSNNHIAHAHLAGAYIARGRAKEAVQQYEAALQISPDYIRVANNLAWLLATDESLEDRNLARAVELAELASGLSESADPTILDTLAVCYAAVDRFDEAIDISLRGIALAEHDDNAALGAEMRDRLALYRRGRPYVDEEFVGDEHVGK